MVQRCSNPKYPQYQDYGGRGITLCVRWLTFANFLADMGARPVGTTLDRMDNDEDYRPGNCRWATKSEQMRNTRRNRWIEIDGRRQCLTDWCREFHINRTTVINRVNRRGVTYAEALGANHV